MARAEAIKTVSVTAGAAVRLYRFVQAQSDGKFDEVGSAQARADGARRCTSGSRRGTGRGRGSRGP